MDEIQFVDCDAGLQRHVGEIMGAVAERHIRLDDGFAFVALDDKTPVGLIAVYRRRLPDPLPETCEGFINIIEVVEAYRRRGIGRRLVEMSIERCRAEGLTQIRAWSSKDKTEAIHMWKALGFALCPAVEHPRGLEVEGYFVARRL
jgi:ribosomal protein S18 acetylase RimI-like enzyme